MESSLAFAPDFSKSGGLIAAVAQDAETLDVLMLAWMNPEAWEKTLETGEAHYYSRSRKCRRERPRNFRKKGDVKLFGKSNLRLQYGYHRPRTMRKACRYP